MQLCTSEFIENLQIYFNSEKANCINALIQSTIFKKSMHNILSLEVIYLFNPRLLSHLQNKIYFEIVSRSRVFLKSFNSVCLNI